jgi:phosphopantothenoylcysteine decarboxylase/phosphopantothenate--cysteine ligase
MKTSSLKNKKILITSGPTWVPIDDVRVISNHSSGQMGKELVEAFLKHQAKVTLLEGPVRSKVSSNNFRRVVFQYFDDLVIHLNKELTKGYDIVVHAAAVSDYKLKDTFRGKISSDKKNITLTLIPTPKIINLIKKVNPKVFLVGFKLEPHLTPQKALEASKKLFTESKCSLVVANSVGQGTYTSYLIQNDKILGMYLSRAKTAQALAKAVENSL